MRCGRSIIYMWMLLFFLGAACSSSNDNGSAKPGKDMGKADAQGGEVRDLSGHELPEIADVQETGGIDQRDVITDIDGGSDSSDLVLTELIDVADTGAEVGKVEVIMGCQGPLDCDDDNKCTEDFCDGGLCVYDYVLCDDGDPCTKDFCNGGECFASPLSCDDGNPCTDNPCDPDSGCKVIFNSAPCGDDNQCTVDDVCQSGLCKGAPLDCEDGNPCTDNWCDVNEGCLQRVTETVVDPADTGEPVVFPAPPAPYVHPRVLFNPQQMASIKQRLEQSQFGQKFMPLALDWAVSNPQLQAVAALLPDEIGLADVEALWTKDEARNIAFFVLAFHGVLFDDQENTDLAIDAVTNYARLILAAQELLPEHAVWASSDWDPDVGWYTGGAGLALAYDVLFDDMTKEQQDTVRGAIAAATSGRRSWGMELPPARAFSSYYMHHGGSLAVAVLAIEGEEGYDEEVYQLYAEAAQNWTEFSLYPSGGAFEDAQTLLALREGSSAMVALARRGKNLFMHQNYRAYVRHVVQTLEPFFGGTYVGHGSGGGLGYPSFWAVARYAYPTDPATNYLWRYYVGDAYQDNMMWQSFIDLMVFGGDWTGDPKLEELKLGTTQCLPRRGLVIMRNDWSADSLYVHFDARPDAMLPGLDNADRGNFTLSALGRSWVPDDLWSQFKTSRDHSLVHIDSMAQVDKAPSVRLVESQDRPEIAMAAADLKYAYDWQWSPPWPDSTTDFPAPWEHETSDPQDLGWPTDPDWLPDTLYGVPDVGSAGLYLWRQPYHPVAKAFRTVVLVRGEKPYLLVLDDISMDDQLRSYEWLLHLDTDVVKKKFTGKDLILADPNDDRRLLVRILQANIVSETPFLVNMESYESAGGTEAKRVGLANTAEDPRFKILLLPYLDGEELPTTEWVESGTALEITVGGHTDKFVFGSTDEGRSIFDFSRDGQALINLL